MAKPMPAELARVYTELRDEVIWIHMKWDVVLQVYSENEAIDLLNNTAPSFFYICEEALRDDAIMAICRVTDNACSGSNKNLTLQRLVDTIDGYAENALKKEAERIYSEVQPKFKFAREHRNRRIAHSDLKTRLNEHPKPLPSFAQKDMNEAFEAIARVMNAVENHFENAETAYSHPIAPDDGRTLLYWLNKGYEAVTELDSEV